MNERNYLDNLLLDIEIFNELKKYENTVNIFDVLKISNAELKHSIVLSYLLNPNENHSLGSKPLQLFINFLTQNNLLNNIKFDDIDYDDFNVLREYKNIDILIKSNKNKIIICIENKIWTDEHDNQLFRYKNIIDEEFSDYKKIYIYLTPGGYSSSDQINWISFSYGDIANIIDELNLSNSNENIKILIKDYKLMIRRNIMNNYELKELCNKIYKKHKQAIDLIIENKDDDSYYLYSIVYEYLNLKASKNELIFNENYSSKTYLRFTTNDLEKSFPLLSSNTSSWKNKHTVFYEIIISKNLIRAQIAFGFRGVEREERFNAAIEYLKRIGFEDIRNTSIVSNYLTKSFTGTIKIDEITFNDEQDKNYIFNKLDEILSPILK